MVMWKRVLARYFAVEGWSGEKKVENRLWTLTEQVTPMTRVADFNQSNDVTLVQWLTTRTKPKCRSLSVKYGLSGL